MNSKKYKLFTSILFGQDVDSKLEITSSHNNSTSQSNYKSLKNDEKKYEYTFLINFFTV